MSSNKTKDKPKKVSSESDSSDDSSSDDDLFHHKAAKSYKQSTWKYSHAPPTSPSEPNKKKNLLEIAKASSPNSKSTEAKKEETTNNEDLLLELQVDMYKNELHKKNAKRNSVTDEDSKKKRKPTDEELKKIILEQKKQRREQKRTKHTHSSSIPPEDIISIDDDLTPTTVENAPSSSSTFPTATTSTLFGNMGSTFSSSSTMFGRSTPTFSNPFRTISPYPSYNPGDFFYERSKNDLQRKLDTLLESSTESVFEKFETIDKSATELSEKERQRIEQSLKKQLEELRPELKLDDSTLIDQEEEADNKGEKIIIRVRWNEKVVPINMTVTDKFQKLKKAVAKQFDAHTDQVTLIFDGMSLDLNSTPEEQGMETDDIIDCKIDKSKPISKIITSSLSSSKKPSTAIEIIDDTATKVTINVRAKEKTFPVKISTTDKFSKIAKYVSKQLNVDDSKVKLLLDGMVLDLNDTPEDHDMEDEDIIDCQVKTK
ncbi:hypothetical protein FDP41_013408 [Naegleria fowleri]|uniref:Ubiquitin-like domain-containing protein n=1 Tax=Naegleria fowleri TaxID=5763 RepID=A0A6A5C0T6_NAEFO|nr:uncharacterized protein FDP41_013408 [Naegleria fowleri]KAF0980194.1 hypothetical protein FDP41_013408 [Naegleria fowleri]CAG4711298.1 unnamed protein product [Naegleria fowleri]